MSPRISRGPAPPRESSHSCNERSGGTAWHDALEAQDFQPVAFSGLTPPPNSPAQTPRGVHAALFSISLRKQEGGQETRSQGPSHGNFPAVFESLATYLQAESSRHSAIYRCQI